jgi:predicted SnoaL-like aldol condensation-catalyzing enzyme
MDSERLLVVSRKASMADARRSFFVVSRRSRNDNNYWEMIDIFREMNDKSAVVIDIHWEMIDKHREMIDNFSRMKNIKGTSSFMKASSSIRRN